MDKILKYINDNLKEEIHQARSSSLGVSCYLAGPIGHVSEDDARTWRQSLRKQLEKMGIGIVDPFTKYGEAQGVYEKIRKDITDTWKKRGEISKIRDATSKYIIPQDIASIESVDFVIAYLPATGTDIVCGYCFNTIEHHAECCGTYGEVTFAWVRGKPVYVVTDR